MDEHEQVASDAIYRRLFEVELPYAIRKVIKLLEQCIEEIEPSSQVHRDDEELQQQKQQQQQEQQQQQQSQIRTSTSRRLHEAKSTNALKRIPSPLMFVRSRIKGHASAGDLTPPLPPSTHMAREVGLLMQHQHSSRPNTPSTPGFTSSASSGATTSVVSQGLRNLSTSKKGFHIVKGMAASSMAPSVSYSTSPSTWMDVSLHMDGFYIRNAKVDLRLQKHQNKFTRKAGFSTSGSHHTFSTLLHHPENPWVLEQVHTVYEKARQQLKALHSLLSQVESLSGQTKENSNLGLQAQACFHALAVSLIDSRNVMTETPRNVFPQVLQTSDSKLGCQFDPSPPPELLIEFSIHLDELIVSAYELYYLASPKEASVLSDSWVQTRDYNQKVFRFKQSGKNVQVVDQVQVHFKVHSFQWVLENLYEAYNTGIRMLRKIEAFNRHENACLLRQGNSEAAHKAAAEMKLYSTLPRVEYSNWIRD